MHAEIMPYTSKVRRRRFLQHAAAVGGLALTAPPHAIVDALLAQSCLPSPPGELIGLVPLHGETARPTPFGTIVGGEGLDARQFTDLSRLHPDQLITPAAEVFIRTAAPPVLQDALARWPLPVDALGLSKPMGTHVIECSGNTDPDNFGLLSAAEWDGVPLLEYLARLPARPTSTDAVLVSGLDYSASSRSSAAGASWVFARAALDRTGAFLATRMNGEPLPPHHGMPVRLVVPGWYGCSWIKWVNEIRFVDADEPVTAQMVEFSLRTHQRVIPKRALDYESPVIDLAATPIRVEKRRLDGRLEYRVVGIVWGGDRIVDRLTIRFRAGDEPTPFSLCPAPRTHQTWSLWEYRWRPATPGVYTIGLAAADPSIRTRRLDVSFYVRRVVIDQV
jgi:DMSO/TMAO reductase YedYZ molybdopterin-dependent catalytic subunit